MADFEDAVYIRVVQYVAVSWLRMAKVGLACAHVFSQPVFLGLFGAVTRSLTIVIYTRRRQRNYTAAIYESCWKLSFAVDNLLCACKVFHIVVQMFKVPRSRFSYALKM